MGVFPGDIILEQDEEDGGVLDSYIFGIHLHVDLDMTGCGVEGGDLETQRSRIEIMLPDDIHVGLGVGVFVGAGTDNFFMTVEHQAWCAAPSVVDDTGHAVVVAVSAGVIANLHEFTVVEILLRRLETRVRVGAVWSTDSGKELADCRHGIGVNCQGHDWCARQCKGGDKNSSFHLLPPGDSDIGCPTEPDGITVLEFPVAGTAAGSTLFPEVPELLLLFRRQEAKDLRTGLHPQDHEIRVNGRLGLGETPGRFASNAKTSAGPAVRISAFGDVKDHRVGADMLNRVRLLKMSRPVLLVHLDIDLRRILQARRTRLGGI